MKYTENSGRAFLFGLRSDGSPTCHPMMAIESNGAPAFNCYRKSVKARNFHRDPRAAALLLGDWETPPSQGRLVTGIMEEIDSIDSSPSSSTARSDGELPAGVPTSVADRAHKRVDEGKRMYFRLRQEG